MELDPKTTACLTLDLQEGILGMVSGSDAVVANAARAVQFARQKQIQIIHVGLGFRKGYPEIPDHTMFAKRLKPHNLFIKGTPSANFHKSLIEPEDLIVYKHRVGGFSHNDLHLILRSLGIQTLILFGVATSGIVLSTVRHAFDLDYQSIVIKDACYDRDEEVHRILTEKVFPGQATVLSVEQLIAGTV